MFYRHGLSGSPLLNEPSRSDDRTAATDQGVRVAGTHRSGVSLAGRPAFRVHTSVMAASVRVWRPTTPPRGNPRSLAPRSSTFSAPSIGYARRSAGRPEAWTQ